MTRKTSTKKFTITIVTSPFGVLPPNAIGAVERLWHGIGVALALKGHFVNIISKKDNSIELDSKQERFKVYPIVGFARSGSIYIDLILDLYYSYKALRILPRSDIVILNTFWSPALAPLFRKKFRKLLYNVQRVPKGQLWIYRNVDIFSAVSEAVAIHIRRENPEFSKKVETIPNPIDFDIFARPKKKSARSSKITIVFTGRIHPEKGLHILVSAAAQLHQSGHQVRVKLIGPHSVGAGGGGDEYVSLLLHKAGSMQLELVPPISDREELAEAIATGDVYCYPSIAENGETFGVAPLEAMAVGVPTVVSSLPCFKEFAVHGLNSLVFDHRSNPEKNLETVLEGLLKDRNLRLRLALAGQETASRFSVGQVSAQYEGLFRRMFSKDQEAEHSH